ncbi:hypothetical protein GCM10023191_100290 [Actinoallomurus oryzae]|jgi:hypothetical protein|uniref:Uncharacterized protein n=1 Tax=Actinoallomurus oryzae TaxID=502180 RepID=A0ABP8R9K3_9ACTN
MGNPAWGHGYHQGFGDGFTKGGVIGAGVTIASGLVVAGAAFGYRKLKARSFAKREQDLSAEESNPVIEERAGDEHEAGEGSTSE